MSRDLELAVFLKILRRYKIFMTHLPFCFKCKTRFDLLQVFFIKKIQSASLSKAGLAFMIYSILNISLQFVIIDPKIMYLVDVHKLLYSQTLIAA